MAFLSPLSFAVVIVVARRHRGISMTPATALAQLLLVLAWLPFVHGVASWMRPTSAGWRCFGPSARQGFGLVSLTIGARLIQAAAMGLILLLESVLGVVWGWLGTSEGPNVPTVLGGLIVLGAVALKLRDDNRRLGHAAEAESQTAPAAAAVRDV